LRVRDGKPNTDAEHRVPTGSGLYAQPNFFTAPLSPALGRGEPRIALGFNSTPVLLSDFHDRN
ncbi:MAG: hypothetical protein L0387_39515, partial [Acidobacteria bacterium]|nr:hypothetical protein [Acidobacteriota bacterium]MCI0720495.1 hypothetical protein [Acidobacteriota bacterium]